MSQAAEIFVDARGLRCPLPLLRARKALMVAEPGATVRVLATDPRAAADFEAYAEASGHLLLDLREADGMTCCLLRKQGSVP